MAKNTLLLPVYLLISIPGKKQKTKTMIKDADFFLIAFFVLCLTACKSVDITKNSANPQFDAQLVFPFQEEHCHGPSIVELTNGDLLVAWFQGSGERWADDVRIMGSRLLKGDTTWSTPFVLADTPGFPDINPMMFMDVNDKLWLWYYPVVANLWESSIPKYRISKNYLQAGPPEWDWQEVLFVKLDDTQRGIQPDDLFVKMVREQQKAYKAYVWEEVLPNASKEIQQLYEDLWQPYTARVDSLVSGKDLIRKGLTNQNGQEVTATLGYPLSRRIGWQTKNKPLIQKNRLIVPLYSDLLDAVIFALSDDWGKHWQFSNPVIGGAGIQATMAAKKDGTLVAYLRDNGPPPKKMQKTISKDNGLTWSIAKDDILKNPGSGFDMTNLHTDDWLVVFNDTEEGRYNLTVAISEDEGKSWGIQKHLENDLRGKQATRSHYPAVIQGKDERIHVVYSFHRKDRGQSAGNSIKYVTFSKNWMMDK